MKSTAAARTAADVEEIAEKLWRAIGEVAIAASAARTIDEVLQARRMALPEKAGPPSGRLRPEASQRATRTNTGK